MKKTFLACLFILPLAAALTFGARVAQADNGLVYLGVGVTSNKLNDIVLQGNALPDIDKTSWKVFAAFRPIRLFAVEADYLDLGATTVEGACDPSACCMEACRGLAESFAHAFAAYAVGFLPIPVPFLDIYGKAGLDRWHLNGQSLDFTRVSENGTSFAWGVGVQAHTSMVGARLEYEDLTIPNSSGAKVASLSVFVNFL